MVELSGSVPTYSQLAQQLTVLQGDTDDFASVQFGGLSRGDTKQGGSVKFNLMLKLAPAVVLLKPPTQ